MDHKKKTQHGFLEVKTEESESKAAHHSRNRSQLHGWSDRSPSASTVNQQPVSEPVIETEKLDKKALKALKKEQRKARVESRQNAPENKDKKTEKAQKPEKNAQKTDKPSTKPEKKRKPSVQQSVQALDTSKNALNNQSRKIQGRKEMPLFIHLSVYGRMGKNLEDARYDMISKKQELHPEILKLGLAYQVHQVIGSFDRVLALLNAFYIVIQDYTSPPNTVISRHLDQYLKPQINFLVSCRPISISMGSAIRELRQFISKIAPEKVENEAKRSVLSFIERLKYEKLYMASQVITNLAIEKIHDGDVILTFGFSRAVANVLLYAHSRGMKIHVVVIDSRPLLEGRKMIKVLGEKGISCHYMFTSGIGVGLRWGRKVTKVILGVHGILSNGAVMARVGTAGVAMMAKERGIPVICLCESIKFSERVQLDSFVSNELGDPEIIVDISRQLPQFAYSPFQEKPVVDHPSLSNPFIEPISSQNPLSGWRDINDLRILNILYDVTPSEFVTVVISEVGLIPCSSVPVVLREVLKNGVLNNGAAGDDGATTPPIE